MRERLLAKVRARLKRFGTDWDPAVVLVPEAVAEVAALLALAPGQVDLEVAHATGWLYWLRYQVLEPGQDHDDLAAAVGLFESVYRAMPQAVPNQIRDYFNGLEGAEPDGPGKWASEGMRHLEQGMRTDDRFSLDEAVRLLREAVAATPDGHVTRAARLSNLSAALRIRFERTGMLTDADEAVDVGRAAVSASPNDDPNRAGRLSNLGTALSARFERTGAQEDLDAAVEVGRAAVAASPHDHPDHVATLSNLGDALLNRFKRNGLPGDLDEAADAFRVAVGATPADHLNGPLYLANLSLTLRLRFEQTGAEEDLDEAVAVGREAVKATPADHPARAGNLSNLGLALSLRFERTGAEEDLDEAVAVGREAVEATPADHPNRAGRLSNLGGALRWRFERTGAQEELDEAVAVEREAVKAIPADHADRALYLSNLGSVVHTRFGRTGEMRDLDEAVTVARAAVKATPTDHPDLARRWSNLGGALRSRFGRTGRLGDLDEAVRVVRLAVGVTPPDHLSRALYLSNLGLALTTRFERTGALADLDAAVDAGRQAVEGKLASARIRTGAARLWGRAAALGERWDLAVDGFAVAAGLLGELAPRELARSDQEGLLAEIGGVGADVAVCAVRAGDPGRAVELFEQGRGVLLGQALDTRSDMSQLKRNHPALHARFVALTADLDQPDTGGALSVPDTAAGNGPVDRDLLAQRRRALRAELDELIAEIRRQDGFDGFLCPAPLIELTPAAAGGPVVIVAVSEFGAYALIVTYAGVADPVGLDGLTPQSVSGEVRAFLTALITLSSPTATPASQKAAGDRLSATLVWLWDRLAGPVLDRLDTLGALAPRDGDRPPRVWWCLSGLLSFLPVHAAGRHDTRSDPTPQTVIDRVVSSYTPTVRALAHARRPTVSPARAVDRIVAVAMPHTPGQDHLPGAQDEVELIERRFPGRVRVLTGPDATRDTVLAALPGAGRAHFACHGTADLTNPSASRLLLADYQTRPLTVLDVARLRLEDAELAFLSACETARPGTRLTDEAIHLTSAFQLAGYRHVVGTLWPVDDEHAVEFADRVYTEVAATGDVARGVHAATRRLRSRWLHDPSVWASHVHVGA